MWWIFLIVFIAIVIIILKPESESEPELEPEEEDALHLVHSLEIPANWVFDFVGEYKHDAAYKIQYELKTDLQNTPELAVRKFVRHVFGVDIRPVIRSATYNKALGYICGIVSVSVPNPIIIVEETDDPGFTHGIEQGRAEAGSLNLKRNFVEAEKREDYNSID